MGCYSFTAGQDCIHWKVMCFCLAIFQIQPSKRPLRRFGWVKAYQMQLQKESKDQKARLRAVEEKAEKQNWREKILKKKFKSLKFFQALEEQEITEKFSRTSRNDLLTKPEDISQIWWVLSLTARAHLARWRSDTTLIETCHKEQRKCWMKFCSLEIRQNVMSLWCLPMFQEDNCGEVKLY